MLEKHNTPYLALLQFSVDKNVCKTKQWLTLQDNMRKRGTGTNSFSSPTLIIKFCYILFIKQWSLLVSSTVYRTVHTSLVVGHLYMDPDVISKICSGCTATSVWTMRRRMWRQEKAGMLSTLLYSSNLGGSFKLPVIVIHSLCKVSCRTFEYWSAQVFL